jgi:hypothetical protein
MGSEIGRGDRPSKLLFGLFRYRLCWFVVLLLCLVVNNDFREAMMDWKSE